MILINFTLNLHQNCHISPEIKRCLKCLRPSVSDQRRAYQSVFHCARFSKRKGENLGRVENKWIIAYFLSIAPSAYPVVRNEIIFYTVHAICFYFFLFPSAAAGIEIVILKKLFQRFV